MATICPFRGMRYNPRLVPDLADVTTPPYDIINPAAQEEYYRRSPYNVIRLELGKTFPGDTPQDNRYTRSAQTFRQWREAGVLLQEERPVLYVYRQAFPLEGRRYTRTGLITALQLEDYSSGIVLPHEETLPKAKADRLELMRTCRANFSSIFALCRDRSGTLPQLLAGAAEQEAAARWTDGDGVLHTLWAVQDEAILVALQQAVKPLPIFIADGHHRYETALQLFRDMSARQQNGFQHVLTTLVDLSDPGLVVLPTHRLLHGLPTIDAPALMHRLEQHFQVRPVTTPADPAAAAGLLLAELASRQQDHAFALSTGQGEYLCTLTPSADPAQLLPGQHSAAWKRLDVALLQQLVLEELLGIGTEERQQGSYLTYTRDAAECLARVRSGQDQLAFLLNPTPVEAVLAVAEASEKMPQKSTYFHPKLATGHVIMVNG